MPFVIREFLPSDARTFLEVHHAAVRVTAAKDYPPEVLEDWAPLPIAEQAINRVASNPNRETRVVAVQESKIVGIGAIDARLSELTACYVSPLFGGKGIGRALMEALEAKARDLGLHALELNASLTSESFYARLGYDVLARTTHVLRSGRHMECVRMRRHLSPVTH